MAQAGFPVGVGMHDVELVLSAEVVVMVFAQDVVRVQDGCLHHEVGTGHVQRDGVCRSQHAQVRDNGSVVVIPTVALGRDVHHEADVEVGLVLQNGFRVFGNLIIEALGGVPVVHHRRVMLAQGDTLSAADALRVVYLRPPVGIEMHGVVGTMFYTDVASDAVFLHNLGLRRGMQFQFAADAGTAHAQVLQCSAEARLFVPLEVVHADDGIGIGDGGTYLRRRTILGPLDGHLAVVRTFEAVADNDLALGGQGVETVLHGALEVVHRIGAASGVERVAVRQERFGAQRAQQCGHACRIIGADIGQVSGLAEVYLDGRETVF